MSSDAISIPPQQPQSFLSKLLGIIIRPRSVFADIAQHDSRAWVLMGLISFLLIMLPVIVSGPIQQQLLRAQFEENRDQFGLPEESADESVNPTAIITSPIITTVIPAITAVIGLAFGWLLWSGALHLISSLTGGRNSYLQMLRVVIWSWVPYGIRAIVQTIYISSTNQLITNPGLSGLVSGGPTPEDPFAPVNPGMLALRAFLSPLEIYLFWQLALLIVGTTAVSGQSTRKSAGAVLIVWAIFMLIRIGFQAGTGALGSALS